MKFEYLPNEILLDIFEYFHLRDLFQTFHNLNFRLNQLLYESFRSYSLDLRSISRYDFDIICQQHLPIILHKITSIHLADNDETPNLPQRFLSQSISVDQFTHLKSLSIHSIQSIDIIHQIIKQSQQVTHLKIIKCFCEYKEIQLINQIWSLPKLTFCHLDNLISKGIYFSELLTPSSTIKYLSIKNIICDFRSLSYVFQKTPSLQHLSTTIVCTEKFEKIPPPTNPLLTKLSLSYDGSIPSLMNLFQHMPLLRSLTISTSYLLLDGDEWQAILTDCLPQLKYFHFKMSFQFPQNYDTNDAADELLATYQSEFWIKKHQWHVQCDWNASDPFYGAILYTLPYMFHDYHYVNDSCSKSTLPNKTTCQTHIHVKNLQCEHNIVNHFIYLSTKFTNLSHLDLILPFNNEFLRNISTFTHLKSLDVTLLSSRDAYQQLQCLLNHTPHLYLLRFSHLSDMNEALFSLSNPSIRRLDFLNKQSMIYNWYFNTDECQALTNSILGRQCQTLIIDIQARNDVLDLVNNLTNLRSLIFQCKDDKGKQKLLSTTDDELIQWFHEHLPSTCTISRDAHISSIIQMWIR
ncbi:unnamed protein product [Adineta ricciae]|uniref:F-box domain-containing protein n=2 Tax=Adineta ricciae TaxID=249248 RepID=A0A814B6J8_ADIRI|nr:unnamed protein product [Adineta ricciae]CAF1106637.1 unnamed protein product [Adineta ricciae]